MAAEAPVRRAGRRGLVWKSIGLTPEQAAVTLRLMRLKRWTFQTLAEEALRSYALGHGEPWPERVPDPEKAAS